MAAYSDLIIDQGTDYQAALDLLADDGTPVDLTNYKFSGQIKYSYYTSTVTANLNITIVDSANGNVLISLTAANSANIPPGRYVYDIKMVDATLLTTRLVEGILTITPQVSA